MAELIVLTVGLGLMSILRASSSTSEPAPPPKKVIIVPPEFNKVQSRNLVAQNPLEVNDLRRRALFADNFVDGQLASVSVRMSPKDDQVDPVDISIRLGLNHVNPNVQSRRNQRALNVPAEAVVRIKPQTDRDTFGEIALSSEGRVFVQAAAEFPSESKQSSVSAFLRAPLLGAQLPPSYAQATSSSFVSSDQLSFYSLFPNQLVFGVRHDTHGEQVKYASIGAFGSSNSMLRVPQQRDLGMGGWAWLASQRFCGGFSLTKQIAGNPSVSAAAFYSSFPSVSSRTDMNAPSTRRRNATELGFQFLNNGDRIKCSSSHYLIRRLIPFPSELSATFCLPSQGVESI